jgi:DNA (cytosine-5)-methyltransferase 1
MARKIRMVDAFAGIGGFRLGAQNAAKELGIKLSCVKSVENNIEACKTYERYFGENPEGDMKKLPAKKYPDHDLLLGGFPCQAFSRNGRIYNFTKHDGCKTLEQDDRAPLVFRLCAILNAKRPDFFVFENVKEIGTICNGDGSPFFDFLIKHLEKDYKVVWGVLDSRDFGLPQQRRRMYFVGFRKSLRMVYELPKGDKTGKPFVAQILDNKVPDKYLLENLWKNRFFPSDEKRTLKDVIEKLSNLRERREVQRKKEPAHSVMLRSNRLLMIMGLPLCSPAHSGKAAATASKGSRRSGSPITNRMIFLIRPAR